MRDYQEYNNTKRQRSGPTGGGYYDRTQSDVSGWSAASSGYAQDSTAATMSYTMRPHPSTESPYGHRSQVSDYSQPHSLPNQHPLTQDYEASYSYSESPISRGMVAPIPSYMDNNMSSYATLSPTSGYQYPRSASSILPPIQQQASGNGVVPSTPATNQNGTYVMPDNRFRGQPNVQGTQGLNNFGGNTPSYSSYKPQ